MTKSAFIIIVILAAVLLLALGFLLFRLVFGYEIEEDILHIKLFHHFTIKRIERADIQSIKQVPFWKTMLVPGFHLVSRMFAKRIEIETKEGWTIFITPRDLGPYF